MIRHISIILLLALSIGLYAQKPVSKPSGSSSKKPDILALGSTAHKPDSVKTKRIIKQWNLTPDFSGEINNPIDTVFSLFNRFRIADKYSPVNATLGNYGLPFYQINFFDRITDPDKYLYNTYYPFMHVPEKALFMNTQVPFTELIWTFAGKKETSEQTFRVRHSQNVNKFLNFGLIYDIIFDLGQYSYQRAEDKTFTFYSSYTGNKYKLFAAVGINNLLALENGGITNKSELSNSNTQDVPVNLGGLNNARSTFKNQNLLLVQRYTIGNNRVVKSDTIPHKSTGLFGLNGTFSYILLIDRSRRSYNDAYPLSGFYDTIYKNDNYTYDSLSSFSIKNSVRFDFATDAKRKFRLGGGFGIRNEIFRYLQLFSQKIPTQTITSDNPAEWSQSNNALIGRLFNSIGEKFNWYLTGELFLSGYKAGDLNLNGEISKSFDMKKGRASWLITGGIINRQPSFWLTHWSSNNFEWNNNMKKEFRTDLGTAFLYPGRNTDIKFNYSIIKNYTDFDTLALPSQYSGGISVAALSVRKGLRAWKFHLDTDLILQKSSNKEILDLPLTTIRSAGYFEHHLKFKKTGGRLNTQIGVDVTYHTLYHPYSYMPATGRFYRQEQTTAGNYPFVNVFINLKLQRTRIFLMFDHVNYGMMGEKLAYNYNMVPNYPMNTRMFRFGLAWTFYN